MKKVSVFVAAALSFASCGAQTEYQCPSTEPGKFVTTNKITDKEATARRCSKLPKNQPALDTVGAAAPRYDGAGVPAPAASTIDPDALIAKFKATNAKEPQWTPKELGPIDKWRYESCLESATKAPTEVGVRQGTRLCKVKFGRLPPCSGYRLPVGAQCHDPS
ncbi:hypothetical protein [Inhella gelatinilytica]|uniref:DUF4124 domain-containing protein n=1 Tax=Inhella gelatinilytica TaxID=2795030 RepID=A0A931NDJ2_9BURK|nr:hypothetical protein [Inhella gelatinilytica]MBH9553142.1 hypothetical protein [Inhella gelatinilytica]